MRSLLPIALAVLLGATADAACAPALASGATQTGTAPGADWTQFFFKPTGTAAFGLSATEIFTWDYSTSPSARSEISGVAANAWGTGTDLSTQSTKSIVIGGGVMKADASIIHVAATDFVFPLGTATPYSVTAASTGGLAGTAGCVDGTTAARYTGAGSLAFANAAESFLLVAEFGCHVIAKLDVVTPFTSTTVVGTLTTAGNTDGFGTAAALTKPRSIVQWKDRFYVTSAAGIRISVLKPQGWWLGKVAGAASPAQTTTDGVAFTAFGIAVATTDGIVNQFTVWHDCSLVVFSDGSAHGFVVSPDADTTNKITGTPTLGNFAEQDPAGTVWVADVTGGAKDVQRYAYGGCTNYISPHSCKWPTASATIALPKTRTPTMPLPKTRTMTYVAPTTVAATSAATSAAAASTTAAAAATTTAAAAATTTAAVVATTTVAATTTAAAAASTTTAAAASTSAATTTSAAGSGAAINTVMVALFSCVAAALAQI